jgi:hypothetical protein
MGNFLQWLQSRAPGGQRHRFSGLGPQVGPLLGLVQEKGERRRGRLG